jgi:multidrug efflux system membrane fusion protein
MHLYRFHLVAAAALLGSALFGLVGCSSGGSKGPAFAMGPVAVRAVSASSSNVPLDLSAIGNVQALSTVDVKARVAGQIKSVHFQEGQDVRAGDVLFELDQTPFLDAIHEAEANLARDIALTAQAKANVVKDQAMLKSAQAQADRAQALEREGIFSKEQTETIVATSESNQATLAADQAAVTSSDAAVRADRARLEDAKLQLSYTTIRAPISGRTGAIQIRPGNLVKDNDATLVTLLQTQPIYVSFSVPQQQLPEIRRYNAERPLEVIALPGGEAQETGKLNFIDNAVDLNTGTIKLKAVFANPKHRLWPGQFVNVKAQLSIEPDRVVVPTQTIETGPNGKYVWVMASDSSVSMRPVNVLRDWGDKSVIGSGLQAGEMVITEGQMRLAPGAKVHVLKPQSQAEATASNNQASGG